MYDACPEHNFNFSRPKHAAKTIQHLGKDVLKNEFATTGIIVFDFELLISSRVNLLGCIKALSAQTDQQTKVWAYFFLFEPMLWVYNVMQADLPVIPAEV